MLEMKSNCEKCAKSLPEDCDDALICSFECTFCNDCGVGGICPNCQGELVNRPKRQKK